MGFRRVLKSSLLCSIGNESVAFGRYGMFLVGRGMRLGGLFGGGVYDAVKASHRLEYHEPFIEGARAFAVLPLAPRLHIMAFHLV
jgi:hypothetical protein